MDALGVVVELRIVGGREDALDGPLVGEARDAALAGTGPEGHEDLRLGTQQVRHLGVLVGADAAVEEADVDLAVLHRPHGASA